MSSGRAAPLAEAEGVGSLAAAQSETPSAAHKAKHARHACADHRGIRRGPGQCQVPPQHPPVIVVPFRHRELILDDNAAGVDRSRHPCGEIAGDAAECKVGVTTASTGARAGSFFRRETISRSRRNAVERRIPAAIQ